MKTKIENIKKRINEAALRAGRNPSDITLLAVSKRHTLEKIKEAFNAGLRDFGENYAQELRDKAAGTDLDINWHFIGPIQENKVKYMVGTAELIHTVSSVKILKAIEKRAARTNSVQNVLVQVKTGNEDTKSGLPPAEVLPFFENFKDVPHVRCLGLMTIPPFSDNPEETRKYFAVLRELLHKVNDEFGLSMHHLSMGMSGDFEVAIEEGATIVRIGTAIFGPRPPKN